MLNDKNGVLIIVFFLIFFSVVILDGRFIYLFGGRIWGFLGYWIGGVGYREGN